MKILKGNIILAMVLNKKEKVKMKLKKLITLVVAAVLGVSAIAPATSQVAEASIFSDSFWGGVTGYLAGRAIERGYRRGKRIYNSAKSRERAMDNVADHVTFHIKHRAYLYYRNGRRVGRQYYMSRGINNYEVPAHVYCIHGQKFYRAGKVHGRYVYIRVKDTAYTHYSHN